MDSRKEVGDVTYSLKSFSGVVQASTLGVTKGEARSLDYSPKP